MAVCRQMPAINSTSVLPQTCFFNFWPQICKFFFLHVFSLSLSLFLSLFPSPRSVSVTFESHKEAQRWAVGLKKTHTPAKKTWLFSHLQRSTQTFTVIIQPFSLLLRAHNGILVWPFPPWCFFSRTQLKKTKKKSSEESVSALCYLSISVAVTLPGSCDKILMGLFFFFALLLSPKFNTSFFVTKTIILPGPCGPPRPSLLRRTKSWNPLMEGNCLTHCHWAGQPCSLPFLPPFSRQSESFDGRGVADWKGA